MGGLRRPRRQSSGSERRGCRRVLYPGASKPRQPYTMTAQLVTIEKAAPTRLDHVLEILSQVNLPYDGVKEHFGDFLVARNRHRRKIQSKISSLESCFGGFYRKQIGEE